jgi:predicted DNA-binding protein with PD1-like motif
MDPRCDTDDFTLTEPDAKLTAMLYTQIDDGYVIRFEDEESFPERFLEFLSHKNVTGGSFTAIGAMRRTRIAFFDIESKEYRDREIDEQVEVLALMGNVAIHEGERIVHAHITLGRSDYSVLGGHLRHGIVRPTLELILVVNSEGAADDASALRRTVDRKFGLPSLDLHERL